MKSKTAKTRKRILFLLLTFSLLPLASVSTFAQGASIDFTIVDGILTKYNGNGGDVVIPDGVTKIGYSAFEGCTTLTSITIPDSVTSIGNSAFSECENLVSINVNLYNKFFSSIDGVLLNKDKTTIEHFPRGKSNKYQIPSGVEWIKHSTFKDCKKLTEIIIPESVLVIEDEAFRNCVSLISVTFKGKILPIFYYETCIAEKNVNFSRDSDIFKSNFLDFLYPYYGRHFIGCDNLWLVYVPVQSLEEYKAEGALESFNILGVNFCETCGDYPCKCCTVCENYPCKMHICESCGITCKLHICEICNTTCPDKCACEICTCDCVNKTCHDCDECEICKPIPSKPCKVCDKTDCAIRHGHVLGNDEISVSDALEILMYLADTPASIINRNDDAKSAAIITDRGGKEPTISDALDILMYLARMKQSKLWAFHNNE